MPSAPPLFTGWANLSMAHSALSVLASCKISFRFLRLASHRSFALSQFLMRLLKDFLKIPGQMLFANVSLGSPAQSGQNPFSQQRM
jgi:hypothetical protein